MNLQGGPVELTAVTRRAKRLGRVPFMVSLALMLVAGMVGLLMLSIKIQSASVDLRQTQAQAVALNNEAAALRAEVDRIGSVTSLEQQAAALGMGPNNNACFLNLDTGQVIGDPKPASGRDLPETVPSEAGSVSPPVELKIYPVPGQTAPQVTTTPPTPADAGGGQDGTTN